MLSEQNSSRDPASGAASASGLGWARRALRRQLDTLTRLAAVALRLVGAVTEIAADPARPFAGIAALERAVAVHGRVSWALRLMAALRARLTNDLRRVERGEPPLSTAENARQNRAPQSVEDHLARLKAGMAAPLAGRYFEHEDLEDDVDDEEFDDEDAWETESPDRETFGRLLPRHSDAEFAEILQRPTDEIIALICRTLGLPADWPRLAEEAWEREQALEAPQAPFPLDGRRARGRGLDGSGACSGRPPPS